MGILKNVRQHSNPIIDIDELKYIASRYTDVKNYVYSRYGGIKSLPILNNYKKEIRDDWVHEDFAKQWKIPARYWKCALDESIANIKSEWSNTKNRVKEAVTLNKNLTDDEKFFIYYVMKADSILYDVLNHKRFKKPERIAALVIREKYILGLLRRYIRKYKGKVPYSHKARSFMIDADMYEYKQTDSGLVIEIMGLKKKKRLAVSLRDKNIHRGNLRIVLMDNGTLQVHRAKAIDAHESQQPHS